MITDLYIKASAPASASRSTAKLMKTGQTTSYRTGDDGDIEAGRATSFTVLAENNPFGNTNRFTDELGGQTYTNNIVIDWSTYDGSTVLGYNKSFIASGTNWNAHIDSCLAVSVGSFTTGWRMPNIREMVNILNYGLTNATYQMIGYAPFNSGGATASSAYWVSNTVPSDTGTRFRVSLSGNVTSTFWQDTSQRTFPVRTFTVTGTTLS